MILIYRDITGNKYQLGWEKKGSIRTFFSLAEPAGKGKEQYGISDRVYVYASQGLYR